MSWTCACECVCVRERGIDINAIHQLPSRTLHCEDYELIMKINKNSNRLFATKLNTAIKPFKYKTGEVLNIIGYERYNFAE